ncbi:hypothetical protein D3C71_1339950 [compost metagenome]
MLQLFDIQPVRLHRNSDQSGSRRAEGIQGADKAGTFTDDGIAFVAQHFAGQLDSLLGAGDNDQFIRFPTGIMALQQLFLHNMAKRLISFRYAILQSSYGILLQNRLRKRADCLGREGLDRRVPRREGNDILPRAGFQNFTNDGWLKRRKAVRKYIIHFLMPPSLSYTQIFNRI